MTQQKDIINVTKIEQILDSNDEYPNAGKAAAIMNYINDVKGVNTLNKEDILQIIEALESLDRAEKIKGGTKGKDALMMLRSKVGGNV